LVTNRCKKAAGKVDVKNKRYPYECWIPFIKALMIANFSDLVISFQAVKCISKSCFV
jgi:hypothetical protein